MSDAKEVERLRAELRALEAIVVTLIVTLTPEFRKHILEDLREALRKNAESGHSSPMTIGHLENNDSTYQGASRTPGPSRAALMGSCISPL